MVAAELAPYVRQTEAAEAVASLAKSLRHLGHNVTVLCPKQPGFEAAGLLLARRLTPLALPDGGEVMLADALLPSGVQLLTFDAPVLFERPGVYGEDGKDYPDNAKRFGLIGQVALAVVRQRLAQGHALDVLHAHDVAAGLSLVQLREAQDLGVPGILTIHDGARQGLFPVKELEDLALPKRAAADPELRLASKLCALKVAMLAADAITTVSPSYAAELADPERVGGLAEVVQALPKPIVGVLCGVDYGTFNPATDAAITSRYDAEDVANKGRCRTHLLRACGLELDVERPLFVHVGEWTRDRAFDVVLAALPRLLKHDLSLVVVGSGPSALEKRLQSHLERHSDRLAWQPQLDSPTLRRALAAADFALMADSHLPCGSVQLAAQRYGAVVVARAVAGIADTIVDADAELETGTGFLFDGADPAALTGAVARALGAYRSRAMGALRRRVMRQDMSWDRPARRYVQIYRQTLGSTA